MMENIRYLKIFQYRPLNVRGAHIEGHGITFIRQLYEISPPVGHKWGIIVWRWQYMDLRLWSSFYIATFNTMVHLTVGHIAHLRMSWRSWKLMYLPNEDFDTRSKCLGHKTVIVSLILLWNVIIHDELQFRLLAPKSSNVQWPRCIECRALNNLCLNLRVR